MLYKKRSWSPVISLLLVLSLILPVNAATAFGTEPQPSEITGHPTIHADSVPSITIDNTLISLSDKGEYTVTVTIPPEWFEDTYEDEEIDLPWLQSWLRDVKWELIREKADSPYYNMVGEDGKSLYPNVYTGDEIGNWRCFNDSGQHFFTSFNLMMFAPDSLLTDALLPLDDLSPDEAEDEPGITDKADESAPDAAGEGEPARADEKDDQTVEESEQEEPEELEEPDAATGNEPEEDAVNPVEAPKDDTDEEPEQPFAAKDEGEGADDFVPAEDEYEYTEPVYEVVILEPAAPASVLDETTDLEAQDSQHKVDEPAGMDGPIEGETPVRLDAPLTEDITLICTFKNNYFYGTGNQYGNRNVQGSFIGDYQLKVSVLAESENSEGNAVAEEVVLAADTMHVNMYDSFRTYMETKAELREIALAASANGRHMEIETFGTSEGGYEQYYVVFAKDTQSVADYLDLKERAETEPDQVKKEITDGTISDYKIPFMINNIHPDENPGVDAQLNFLWKLATEDVIAYTDITAMTAAGKTLEGELKGSFAYMTDILKDSGWATNMGRLGNNIQGAFKVDEMYETEDQTLAVSDILDHFIFIISPNENPDGRVLNTRRNMNAFDLNRDGAFQTQAETINMMQLINKWNPTVLIELHGYVPLFLIEPCTPPHEPNLEYDLLIEHFYKGAEAFGNAAIGSLAETYYNEDGNNTYTKYVIPLRDYFGYESASRYEGDKWYAWDDLSTNYTPSYAMLNSGTLGYTIETPYNNEGSTDLFEYGAYGMLEYFIENKEAVFLNQLEFFSRGVNNKDARETIEPYYYDLNDKPMEPGTWRVANAENDNYFPEYYVIPVDVQSQKNPAAAYEMEGYLLRNGIRLEELTEDVTVGNATYKKGSIVVNMRQAKRNYANAVLWNGVDASGFAGLYSESVTSFPYLRGFDCDPITKEGAFAGKTTALTAARTAGNQLVSKVDGVEHVVILNNGLAAIQAVNAMLDQAVEVSLITGNNQYKGNYLVSKDVWDSLSDDYVLVGVEVEEEPSGAYAIAKPKVFLVGRYAPFHNQKITSGYYKDWFADGYGYWDYYNNYSNGTSCFDVMAYAVQMGFTVVENPAEADVIVGSIAANLGAYGDETVAAILAGKPYISHGSQPLEYIQKNILTNGFSFVAGGGAESLHYITYGDSVVTAARSNMGDQVIYNYGGSYITSMPRGARALYSVANTNDFHIAGCYYNVYDTSYKGAVEAFEYITKDLDITVFANSIVNKAHQQDDYVYAATAIYSKMLGDEFDNSTGSGSDGGSSSGSRGGGSSGTAAPETPAADGGSGSDSGAGVTASSFGDVKEGSWYYEAVDYVVSNGLFAGTSSTQFSPDMEMTRAMLVTVLGRLAEQLGFSTAGYTNSFTDVPTGSYYANYVGWAAANGIVSGYSADRFAPDDNVTREQMAVLLVRFADYAGLELTAGTAKTFTDTAGISSWAADDVSKAAAAGLLSGYEDGTFRPQNTAARAEVATVVMNLNRQNQKAQEGGTQDEGGSEADSGGEPDSQEGDS